MEEKNIKDTIRAKAAEAAEAAAEAAETQDKEEYGDIRIADEVICIVASLAAQEVAHLMPETAREPAMALDGGADGLWGTGGG